jgi:hypothetical protein
MRDAKKHAEAENTKHSPPEPEERCERGKTNSDRTKVNGPHHRQGHVEGNAHCPGLAKECVNAKSEGEVQHNPDDRCRDGGKGGGQGLSASKVLDIGSPDENPKKAGCERHPCRDE